MKGFKKSVFIALTFIFVAQLAFPLVTIADQYGIDTAKNEIGGGLLTTSGNIDSVAVARILGRLVAPFLQFIALVLFGFIIYSGYLWLTAGGNEEQVTKAKTIMTNAIVGIAIIMFAYFITTLVTNQLGASVNVS